MSVTARRVQLYLPEAQYKGVRHLAQEKRTSFAHIVREALDGFLRKSGARWEEDPITGHIGLFEGKGHDLSTHHDRYLYDG